MLSYKFLLCRIPNRVLYKFRKLWISPPESPGHKKISINHGVVQLEYHGEEDFRNNIRNIYEYIQQCKKVETLSPKIIFPTILNIKTGSYLNIFQSYFEHCAGNNMNLEEITKVAISCSLMMNASFTTQNLPLFTYPELIVSILDKAIISGSIKTKIENYLHDSWKIIQKCEIGIVHGDIWNDNILISSNNIAVIDYDKMHINSIHYDVVFAVIQNVITANQKIFRRWYYVAEVSSISQACVRLLAGYSTVEIYLKSVNRNELKIIERFVWLKILLELVLSIPRWHPFPKQATKTISELITSIISSDSLIILSG